MGLVRRPDVSCILKISSGSLPAPHPLPQQPAGGLTHTFLLPPPLLATLFFTDFFFIRLDKLP